MSEIAALPTRALILAVVGTLGCASSHVEGFPSDASVRPLTDAPTQFAVSGEVLQMRADSIRTTTPVQLEAYLDRGDIHVVTIGSVPVSVVAIIAHASASHATATGRHIVVNAGGSGIRTTE